MSSEWHDKARRAQDELRAGTEILLDLMKTARSGSTSLEAVEGRARGDEPTMPMGEVQDEILEALDKIATVRRFVEYSVLRAELAEKREPAASPTAAKGTPENPCDALVCLTCIETIVTDLLVSIDDGVPVTTQDLVVLLRSARRARDDVDPDDAMSSEEVARG